MSEADIVATLVALKAGLLAKGFSGVDATMTVGSDGEIAVGLWMDEGAVNVTAPTKADAIAKARAWISDNRPDEVF